MSRSYTISDISLYRYRYLHISIYIVGVGRTPYGRRRTSRTKLENPLQSTFRRKLKPTFTAICLVLLTNQFDAFFNPKNASETSATNNPSPSWEKVFLRVLAPPVSFNIELRRQRQPLTFRPTPVPNGP